MQAEVLQTYPKDVLESMLVQIRKELAKMYRESNIIAHLLTLQKREIQLLQAINQKEKSLDQSTSKVPYQSA